MAAQEPGVVCHMLEIRIDAQVGILCQSAWTQICSLAGDGHQDISLLSVKVLGRLALGHRHAEASKMGEHNRLDRLCRKPEHSMFQTGSSSPAYPSGLVSELRTHVGQTWDVIESMKVQKVKADFGFLQQQKCLSTSIFHSHSVSLSLSLCLSLSLSLCFSL